MNWSISWLKQHWHLPLHFFAFIFAFRVFRRPAAALVLILATSAESADTIAGRASMIDATRSTSTESSHA